MASPRFPIPQGTLDMLILQALSLEAAHGYAIAQRLLQISRERVNVNQGSLYPHCTVLNRSAGCDPNGGVRRRGVRPSSMHSHRRAGSSLRGKKPIGTGWPRRFS
jgi:hypothetical protein